MKQKIRLYFLFLIFISLSISAEEREVTIYVDDGYKPFSYAEQGMAKGVYIDILKIAFSRMPEFKVEMVPVPWNRGKKIMEMGEGFGLMPPYFHGQDWQYLYPYSLAFNTETIVAVCIEEAMKIPRDNWPEDYQGLIVGSVAGYDGWGGEVFKDLVRENKIFYQEVPSSNALITMLTRRRIDCIMMENSAFDYEFDDLKQSGLYDEKKHAKLIKGATIGTDAVYIGYSEKAIKSGKYPYQYEFRKSFDSVIYKMIKSGEIKSIMDAYQN